MKSQLSIVDNGTECSGFFNHLIKHKYLEHVKWQQLVAGFTGGTVTTLFLHPLELAKIRLQVNEGTGVVAARPRSTRFVGTMREIYRGRGFPGFYQGITPNLLGSSSAWGLYFLTYGAIKSWAQDGDCSRKLSTLEYLGYAYISGTFVLIMTNPLWVAKTRMCLQYENVASSLSTTRPNTFEMLSSIWRFDGIKGFYRGFVPSLVGVGNGAINFLLYEEFRNFYNGTYKHRRIDAHLLPLEYLTIATIAKAIAIAVTYPYQVVRSRLQDQHRQYAGISELIRTLLKFEGVHGFYKGLFPNIIRTAPACGLTFLVYENVNQWLA